MDVYFFLYLSNWLPHFLSALRFRRWCYHGFVIFVWILWIFSQTVFFSFTSCFSLFNNYFLTLTLWLCSVHILYDLLFIFNLMLLLLTVNNLFRWRLYNACLDGLLNFKVYLWIIHGNLFDWFDICKALPSKCTGLWFVSWLLLFWSGILLFYSLNNVLTCLRSHFLGV